MEAPPPGMPRPLIPAPEGAVLLGSENGDEVASLGGDDDADDDDGDDDEEGEEEAELELADPEAEEAASSSLSGGGP